MDPVTNDSAPRSFQLLGAQQSRGRSSHGLSSDSGIGIGTATATSHSTQGGTARLQCTVVLRSGRSNSMGFTRHTMSMHQRPRLVQAGGLKLRLCHGTASDGSAL